MKRVKGKLCRSSKGRFTKCRTSGTTSGRKAKRRKPLGKASSCRYGKVKSGARKGLCRKQKRR